MSRIFVSNLPWSITPQELLTFFSAYGIVKEVHIEKDQDGRSKGYGWVRFTLAESAQLALTSSSASSSSSSQLTLEGRPLTIAIAKQKKQKGNKMASISDNNLNDSETRSTPSTPETPIHHVKKRAHDEIDMDDSETHPYVMTEMKSQTDIHMDGDDGTKRIRHDINNISSVDRKREKRRLKQQKKRAAQKQQMNESINVIPSATPITITSTSTLHATNTNTSTSTSTTASHPIYSLSDFASVMRTCVMTCTDITKHLHSVDKKVQKSMTLATSTSTSTSTCFCCTKDDLIGKKHIRLATRAMSHVINHMIRCVHARTLGENKSILEMITSTSTTTSTSTSINIIQHDIQQLRTSLVTLFQHIHHLITTLYQLESHIRTYHTSSHPCHTSLMICSSMICVTTHTSLLCRMMDRIWDTIIYTYHIKKQDDSDSDVDVISHPLIDIHQRYDTDMITLLGHDVCQTLAHTYQQYEIHTVQHEMAIQQHTSAWLSSASLHACMNVDLTSRWTFLSQITPFLQQAAIHAATSTIPIPPTSIPIPPITISIYGSMLSGVSLSSSDMDITLHIPYPCIDEKHIPTIPKRAVSAAILSRVQQACQQIGWSTSAVLNARVPILHIKPTSSLSTSTSPSPSTTSPPLPPCPIDITTRIIPMTPTSHVPYDLNTLKSSYIYSYTCLDMRLAPCMRIIKSWSIACHMDSSHGYLNTYSLYLMCIMAVHVQQQTSTGTSSLPIIPCDLNLLSQLPTYSATTDRYQDGARIRTLLTSTYTSPSTDMISILSLVRFFFHLYTHIYNPHTMILSARTASFQPRHRPTSTTSTSTSTSFMHIEDPIDPDDNCARTVLPHTWKQIRRHMLAAIIMLDQMGQQQQQPQQQQQQSATLMS